MSNLPGYLEREKKNEKILNVGVLDWKHLEQWKYNHKHVPHRSSTSSTYTSNTSSYVSEERLSGYSSCPYGQRILRPSLKSHFMASPIQGHSDAIKSSRDSVGNCQNFRGRHNDIGTHSKYLDDNLFQEDPNSRLKGCDKKYLDPYIDKERDNIPNDRMHYEAASCARLGKSTQDGGMEGRVDTLREPDTDTVLRRTLSKSKPFDLRLTRDSPKNNHYRFPHMPKSTIQKSENSSRSSFPETPKELSPKDFNFDISHSCPLPVELSCNNFQLKGSGQSSTDLESIKFSASTFSSPLSTTYSVKMGISPSRSTKAEERKETTTRTTSANLSLQGLDQKVTSDKSRSSSPFRRLSISIGYTSKGPAYKRDDHVPHLSSIEARKSSSKNVRGYASSNISANDKPGDADRKRSSPLRRLLDPLLKPKPNAKKYVPSVTRALLKIVVRNDLPLFTFAVDNTRDVLAATVKNLSAIGNDECHSIYTIFTFREVKKKNRSWINQANRSKGPDYIPHGVAQMKVSDSHDYDLARQNCADSSTTKEFVLFSVNLRQRNAEAIDYQPNDELAAIVVKIPKAISCINSCHQSSFQSDSQDPMHATVLLPSGVHSLPSQGGPSSLIERWKSGGSCDCGGWDLACKLQVIATENQPGQKPTSSKAYLANQLELFMQGNDQEQQCAFSFTQFKHGMYSIAFDSSLSILQAFSICIALVDSKTPNDLSGSINSTEDKNQWETLLMQAKEVGTKGI
ncbi:hypothetical protein TanjilG_23520 [Lupinus angustifolius]|uniref:DUF3527 domain-containing protein n=1 Tax=Lupinus angustifolius TaxID=3871 RepID=A0A4P1R9S5_LUPAN|nr:hypothetical protein TanjilG_23520 [Lupinus angustifolius]